MLETIISSKTSVTTLSKNQSLTSLSVRGVVMANGVSHELAQRAARRAS